MAVAGVFDLVKNVPMPQFTVTAQIQLAGADAAHGHADFIQVRPAAHASLPAFEEGFYPIGVEFFIGGN